MFAAYCRVLPVRATAREADFIFPTIIALLQKQAGSVTGITTGH
jgi:hypothetical protein